MPGTVSQTTHCPQERVERLGRWANIPPRHISAQEGVLAMAPSHALAAVVHACDNYTTAVCGAYCGVWTAFVGKQL